MKESEFEAFIEEAFQYGAEVNKKLLMSPKAAKEIRAGIDLGSEHFHWIESEPNVFELVERNE